jgi:hypothetical protein
MADSAVQQRDHVATSREDESLGELFSRAADDLSSLVRTHVELARTEIREEARRAGRAGGMLSGGAAAGYLALILVSFAAAFALDEVMHIALACFVVGIVWAIVSAVLLMRGREEVQNLEAAPETTTTLKEDATWVKQQMS